MEPVESGIVTVLGVKLTTALFGALGAFISLRFFDGLKVPERWGTFLGGWGLAVGLAGPLTVFFELKPIMEQGLSLAIGLFGMSITAAIIKLIRDTKWSEIIRSRFGKGGDKGRDKGGDQ